MNKIDDKIDGRLKIVIGFLMALVIGIILIVASNFIHISIHISKP